MSVSSESVLCGRGLCECCVHRAAPAGTRAGGEGAGSAGAHFTDGETEAHSSVPEFTLQAAEGVGSHPGVQPESSAGSGGHGQELFPQRCLCLPASAAEEGHCPSMNVPSAFFQFQLQFWVRCRGLAIEAGTGRGRGKKGPQKEMLNRVKKNLFCKNSPSCLSSRARVSHPLLAPASTGAAPTIPSLPSSPSAPARLKVPRGPGSGLLSRAGGRRAQCPMGAAAGPCNPHSLTLQLPC